MITIVGCLYFGAALLIGGESASDQVRQSPAGVQANRGMASGSAARAGEPAPTAPVGDDTAKADEQAASVTQSGVEQGVLVVRHGVSGTPAADSQVPADAALVSGLAQREEAGRAVLRPYRLVKVWIDQPWKYSRPREGTQAQREHSWERKPARDWTYHPVRQRSSEEVERLTKYRPMLP